MNGPLRTTDRSYHITPNIYMPLSIWNRYEPEFERVTNVTYVLRQQIADVAHLQHIGCKRESIQNRSRTNRTVAAPYCIFATYVPVAHNVHTL